ncbi:MAG: hypothetical protein Q7R64_00150 [bacterium]|nr:hypothetical protein [bacterium]
MKTLITTKIGQPVGWFIRAELRTRKNYFTLPDRECVAVWKIPFTRFCLLCYREHCGLLRWGIGTPNDGWL